MSISYFGGHIKDYPNARRMFPGKKKRLVSVSIHKYYGIGAHFHVTLSEENNPIWDAKEKGWRECWDDTKAKGRIEFTRAQSLTSARAWIEKTMAKEFPPKTHRLDRTDLAGITEEDEKRWNEVMGRALTRPLKEGD